MEIDQREKDIQILCRAVLAVGTNFWDNPNGPYRDTCPFCGNYIEYGGDESWKSMDDIRHELDCAYLIAKDLSTGITKEDI